jgi:hypothetical protein
MSVAVRAAAVAAALAQLVALVIQASYVYSHNELSQDFYLFEQARYLIAHGVFDPYSTGRGFYYWQNHGEFIMWPLAYISRVTVNSGFFFLLLQAVCTAATTCVGSLWLIEAWERRQQTWTPPAVLVSLTCIALMLLNPWVYLADSFDFHFQAVDALLLIFSARAIDRARWRPLLVYVPLLLGTGDVAGTYVVALGVSALIVARVRGESIGAALAMILAGGGWTLFLGAIGADQGYSVQQFYGYLTTASGNAALRSQQSLLDVAKGLIIHPARAVQALGRSSGNIWANVGAPGLLGAASPWALPVVLVTVLSYGLINRGFGTPWSRPSFQSLPTYALISVGLGLIAIWCLNTTHRRVRLLVLGAAGIGAAQAFAWSAVMLPRISAEWTDVTPRGAAALDRAKAVIPRNAEVIAQQGVVGAFADHRYVYLSEGIPDIGKAATDSWPIHRGVVYVVAALFQGAQTPAAWNYPLLTQTATLSGARIIYADAKAGVWVVRWRPPRSAHRITIHSEDTFPAWALPSDNGRIVRPGSSARTWYRATTRWRLGGNLTWGDYFQLGSGTYTASAVIDSRAPITVQVWDDTTGHLLVSRIVSAKKKTRAHIPFHLREVPDHKLEQGAGIFHYNAVPAPAGNTVEVRVFTTPGVYARAYSVGVRAS